jgi:tetratricopeptide (TPR) repeat protein
MYHGLRFKFIECSSPIGVFLNDFNKSMVKNIKQTPKKSPAPDKDPLKHLARTALPILIILLVLIFYSPAMNADFIWDDDDYVTKNENLRSLAGLRRIWLNPGATYQYYPLVHTSFWVEYHLWQLHPFGYHVVNILVHGLSSVILFLILRKLGLSWAWLAASIFALHPVHVESVAWITERKNTLSGLFYLLSLLYYLRYIDPPPEASRTRSRRSIQFPGEIQSNLWRCYVPALFFFLCALLSKTVAASLPVSIFLLLWWKKNRITWKDVLPLIPFFILGGVLGLITANLEKMIVGAKGAQWDWSFTERCLIAGRALWFYAGKLLIPHPLIFIYPKWQISAKESVQYLYPLIALFVIITLWLLRGKTGKAPLAAVLFFIVSLFPALGFFNVYPMLYSYVADHFQYLASIGLIILYSGLIASGVKRLLPSNLKIQHGLLAIIPLALGILTWRQAHVYKDIETLWRETLAKNPNAWIAHNNLATLMTDQGKIDEAIQHLKEAIRLNPKWEIAHYNLGYAISKKGDTEEGMKHYRKAIELNPKYTSAYINLGIAYDSLGDYKQAIQNFNKAKDLMPGKDSIYLCLGNSYASLGSLDEAIPCYQKTLSLNPNKIDARLNLASALLTKNNIKEAIAQFNELLRLQPDHEMAHNFLGNIYASQGDWTRSLEHYKHVLRINPKNADTMNNAGVVLARMEKWDEAIDHYQRAAQINPHLPKFHSNLGDVLLKKGKVKEALEAFCKELEISPKDPWVANRLAWIRATSQAEDIRNAGEAVRLGEMACQLSDNKEATILDTLAAAYAEAGRFQEAIKTAEKALELARSSNQKDLVIEIESRIELYRERKPFRE